MQENKLINPLFETIITAQDLKVFKQNLNVLISLTFSTRESFESKLSQYLNIAQMQAMDRLVKERKINVNNADSLRNFLLEIKSEAESLTIIGIHFAKELPLESLKKITGWFNQNLGKTIILDIQTDPDILGGVVIYHHGRYSDYSLKKNLIEMADREELKLSNLLVS